MIASKSTLEKIKLSKAKYYRRIKQLSDLGLVMRDDESDERVYKLTPLGEIVYRNQVVTLNRIAADNNIMEVVTNFIFKNKSANKGFESAVKDITQELISKNDPGLWNLEQIRLFETREEYDSEVVKCASGTKSMLYLATRSLDLGTLQAAMRAAERGAKVELVYTDWRDFYLEALVDPSNNDLFEMPSGKFPVAARLLQTNRNISIQRVVKIPYSFVVSDSFRVALEIADPEDTKSFFAGVELESTELARKLVSYYIKFRNNPSKGEPAVRLS